MHLLEDWGVGSGAWAPPECGPGGWCVCRYNSLSILPAALGKPVRDVAAKVLVMAKVRWEQGAVPPSRTDLSPVLFLPGQGCWHPGEPVWRPAAEWRAAGGQQRWARGGLRGHTLSGEARGTWWLSLACPSAPAPPLCCVWPFALAWQGGLWPEQLSCLSGCRL